jgi:hypothetical protein
MTRTEPTSPGGGKKGRQPRRARGVQPFLDDHLDLIPEGALDTLECLPGQPRR